MLDPATLAVALEAAVAAAQEAGREALSRFRRPGLRVEAREDGSPVTEADRAAERTLRAALIRRFPSISILGQEEGLDERSGSPLRWVVDPIGGTISYSRGIPLFGTAVALVDTAAGRSLLGVIHLPALGETYAGARGLGSFGDGERLQFGPGAGAGTPELGEDRADIPQILVAAGDPAQFRLAACGDVWPRLTQSPLLRGYTDCFGHAMVLRGAVDVMVDPHLSPWDLAASTVLVEEAGGAVFTRPSLDDDRSDAVLGRPDLAQHVAELLGWLPA